MTQAAEAIDVASERTDDGERGQYVNFTIDAECFAFPMQTVQEIIRVPETVAVPLTSRSLMGLANLRGSVIPVLSLRGLLGLTEKEATDASRVLVIDHGRPVGLVVDRVASVMNVDRTDVEDATNIKTTLDTDVLAGAVKNQQGWDLVLLLDASKVLDGEFGAIAASSEAANDTGSARKAEDRGDEDAADDSTRQLVSFLVDGQEYAFPIARVEEIVRVPDSISQVPNADQDVFGLINLRQRLLPLLGLRRMFGLADTELGEDTRIVVVRLSATQTVGMIVDKVREVLRVRQADLDEVPPLLFQGGTDGEFEAVCRLDEGKRLVSILSVEAMFHHPAVQQGLAQTQTQTQTGDTAVIEADDAADQAAGATQDDIQLVVFRLAEEEYGVEINSVQEIIRLPDQFSKVPKTAAFIDGMVNLRGAVLPVVDLRVRLGMDRRADRDDRQRIMVLNLGGAQTGFVVDSVSEVLRLQGSEIEEAPRMSAEQARMMGSVANLKKQGRMILLIDPRCLLDKGEIEHLHQLDKTPPPAPPPAPVVLPTQASPTAAPADPGGQQTPPADPVRKTPVEDDAGGRTS
ncbi:chemotaxis protein CheW [Rhodospira trueperi]|uniref:Chemotaxis protein CheW n=1 Tax=Rhodospira trueperi TaxID=69960 RepID=A0A1G7HAE5_9PROT|nr:chemotaxis protein CheW [Rhodospira trueperi]SDE97402.1 purine-binding chemotaxis protein CheW [Rhodospira trueperi]